jgi:hypothetical protein
VEKAAGIYAFSHLSFHEYFCALSYDRKREIAELFQRFRGDVRYREIVLLAIEMSFDANDLILAILAYVKNEVRCGAADVDIDILDDVLEMRVPMNEKLRIAISHCLREYRKQG